MLGHGSSPLRWSAAGVLVEVEQGAGHSAGTQHLVGELTIEEEYMCPSGSDGRGLSQSLLRASGMSKAD